MVPLAEGIILRAGRREAVVLCGHKRGRDELVLFGPEPAIRDGVEAVLGPGGGPDLAAVLRGP
eukprot:12718437-Alexandrium_andersonii.AAC.1